MLDSLRSVAALTEVAGSITPSSWASRIDGSPQFPCRPDGRGVAAAGRNSIGTQVRRAVLVERYFAGVSAVRLVQLGLDTHAAVAQLAAAGLAVTYVGSTAVPEDESCFCLFAADSMSAVELVNRRLLVPSAHVAGALIDHPPLAPTTEIRTP